MYLVLIVGVFLLILGPILGGSLSSKQLSMYGVHKTNKATATWVASPLESGRGPFSSADVGWLTESGLLDHDVAFSMGTTAPVVFRTEESLARVLGVSDRYRHFHEIRLKAGSFITPRHENQPVVVIDEQLAQAIFHHDNVVGLELEIQGGRFRIIGVVESDDSLVGTLAGQGYGTAYIPVSQLLELGLALETASLEVEAPDTGISKGNIAELEMGLAAIGQDPSDYRIIDYNTRRLLLEQGNHLRNSVFGGLAMVILFGWLRTGIRAAYRLIQARLQERYFSEVIRKDLTRLLPHIVGILTVGTVMVLLWKLIRFRLYIAPESIPNELIDVFFWMDLITERLQTRLSSSGHAVSPGEVQLDVLDALQTFSLLVNFLLGLPLFWFGLYQARILGEKVTRVTTICCGAVVGSLCLGVILLVMFRMPLFVDVKGVLLVFIFLFLAAVSPAVGNQSNCSQRSGWGDKNIVC